MSSSLRWFMGSIEDEQFDHTQKLQKIFSNVNNNQDNLALLRLCRVNRLLEEDLTIDDSKYGILDEYKKLIKEYEEFWERNPSAKIFKIVENKNEK